jgi:hypothetical protein
MNLYLQSLKKVFNNEILLFIVILFLCIPLYACKESETSTTKITKPKTMSDDKKQLTSIISKLNTDYSSIMGMYDLDMEVFVTNKSQYVNTLSAVLSKMDYLDKSFKEKLVNTVENQKASEESTNLRPYIDPLFKAVYASEKIIIHSFDIEDNMANVSVQLYDSFDKITSSFTNLFFDKNEEGKWILSGNEISATERESFPTTVSAEKLVGLYMRKDNNKLSYNLKKNEDSYILEYCEKECQTVGEVKEIQMPEFLTYHIIMKNVSGEMIPTYTIIGKEMTVFEYDVDADKWVTNVYIFSEGNG